MPTFGEMGRLVWREPAASTAVVAAVLARPSGIALAIRGARVLYGITVPEYTFEWYSST
eukprot:COSAG06_NODE_1228_length_10179_cov_3.735119_3_plen_59_part_00